MGADDPAQLDLFRQRLPRKPYCSDDATASMIRTTEHAVRHSYIQHNPPHLICWLVFDLDHKNALYQWYDAHLPPPAFITIDTGSDGGLHGSGHVVYGVTAPVARTEMARTRPLRFAAAVEHAYRRALHADEGYAGLVTKNPFHAQWEVWTPAPADESGVYELCDLAEWVTLPAANEMRKSKSETHGLGRNCSLFEHLRHWAYREIRKYWGPAGLPSWNEAVLRKAEKLNTFPEPLPFSEVKATAKSVAKWTWRNITPQGLEQLIAATHTPEIQRRRGEKKGEKRRQENLERALQMKAEGHSNRQIGLALGADHKTIASWLERSGWGKA